LLAEQAASDDSATRYFGHFRFGQQRPLLVPEKLYHRRRDIHARFGGQEQGGMMTPAQHNLIFLVTGNSGRQHDYKDRWDGDGSTFFYFGEGQLGI
jgi:hypothetical protein